MEATRCTLAYLDDFITTFRHNEKLKLCTYTFILVGKNNTTIKDMFECYPLKTTPISTRPHHVCDKAVRIHAGYGNSTLHFDNNSIEIVYDNNYVSSGHRLIARVNGVDFTTTAPCSLEHDTGDKSAFILLNETNHSGIILLDGYYKEQITSIIAQESYAATDLPSKIIRYQCKSTLSSYAGKNIEINVGEYILSLTRLQAESVYNINRITKK